MAKFLIDFRDPPNSLVKCVKALKKISGMSYRRAKDAAILTDPIVVEIPMFSENNEISQGMIRTWFAEEIGWTIMVGSPKMLPDRTGLFTMHFRNGSRMDSVRIEVFELVNDGSRPEIDRYFFSYKGDSRMQSFYSTTDDHYLTD